MIGQHLLQQQRLDYNHDRLLNRYNRIITPTASEFRAFGTSSLPGRDYEHHLDMMCGNQRRRDSLVSQSRAGVGSSSETYRWMEDGGSDFLPRNINSVMQHTRGQSIPLVHAEKFQPIQVYDHPVFGPTPAYIRPIFNQRENLHDDISDIDVDDEVRSFTSNDLPLKMNSKDRRKSSSTIVRDNDDTSEYTPKGYISYKKWKAKVANLIPVNPLLFNIYTQRPNGSINSYGQSLYAPPNLHGRNEDVFTPDLSDDDSVSSDRPREPSSASSQRYQKLQPSRFPSTGPSRPLPSIRAGNGSDLSDNESSPPDSPVPYLSRNKPTPSTLNTSNVNTRNTSFPSLTTTNTTTTPPAPTFSSTNTSNTPPAPTFSSTNTSTSPPTPKFTPFNTTSTPSAPPLTSTNTSSTTPPLTSTNKLDNPPTPPLSPKNTPPASGSTTPSAPKMPPSLLNALNTSSATASTPKSTLDTPSVPKMPPSLLNALNTSSATPSTPKNTSDTPPVIGSTSNIPPAPPMPSSLLKTSSSSSLPALTSTSTPSTPPLTSTTTPSTSRFASTNTSTATNNLIKSSSASTIASNIPPAPPMPASLLPKPSTTTYTPLPSLPTTPYQAPSNIPISVPSAPSVAGSTTKSVTFGGLSSMPVINDVSSSSDSDDDEKNKRKRRKKRQAAAAAAGVAAESSSSDD